MSFLILKRIKDACRKASFRLHGETYYALLSKQFKRVCIADEAFTSTSTPQKQLYRKPHTLGTIKYELFSDCSPGEYIRESGSSDDSVRKIDTEFDGP